MIPYLDLKKQYHSIKSEIDSAVASVLESGQFVLGKEVEAFEEEFAAYCGVRHAVAVNTGTSALHLSLLAAGVGPGDEVITTPLTFVATVAAILYTGAKPVFVDIEPTTLNMDVSRINKVVTNRTKAILPVHLHGKPVDMVALIQVAQENKLIVIEDAAQAHGAEIQGRRVGSLGAMGCFSFYPGKNLGAYGEGGAITTNNPNLAKQIRLLRDWGAEKKYYHDLKGFNFRMETLQGAILRVKLRHLEKWTEVRRRLAQRYDEHLKNTAVQIPSTPNGFRHVYHVYAVLTDFRDRLQEYLMSKDIHTNIHYPIPVHLQKAYSDLGYKAGDFPIAEKACDQILSLPLYPEMTEIQVEEVIAAVRHGVDKLKRNNS
ncbi:MAG TPA: DegT/DnrJ/EryC1/StrS family aminotransferase [bacterium]|nr:DegT/DnrJ/EryC1/StrS family aminotransferase [bacterium]